jgi:hypothetical protein
LRYSRTKDDNEVALRRYDMGVLRGFPRACFSNDDEDLVFTELYCVISDT